MLSTPLSFEEPQAKCLESIKFQAIEQIIQLDQVVLYISLGKLDPTAG